MTHSSGNFTIAPRGEMAAHRTAGASGGDDRARAAAVSACRHALSVKVS